MAAPARDVLGGLALDERLAAQLRFCLEIDKVKHVLRRNLLADGSRREGDAEHQWHLALMALLLAEHAAEPVDAGRAAAMALVHDLVEIDTGDVFVYDHARRAAAAAGEAAAAERIFGLLPADQAAWVWELWREFEEATTPTARYARALDRLQPMLLNASAHGGAWVTHAVTAAQVRTTNRIIEDGAPGLWEVAVAVIDAAVAEGLLAEG